MDCHDFTIPKQTLSANVIDIVMQRGVLMSYWAMAWEPVLYVEL